MIKLTSSNQKFLITGGTGFIGSKLVEEILKDGHKVTILTRNKKLLAKESQVNYITTLDENNFDYDIVINLCGETISQRWSSAIKTKIYNSRIKTTQELARIIQSLKNPPKLVISGSAIGYYGISADKIFDESSKIENQNLFSQELCESWEDAAKPIATKSRLVIIRTGVVIGKNGGIMKKMLLPFKLGLGGKIGQGNQYLSWIALEDAIGIINLIINEEKISQAINLTAPSVTTNEIFSKSLAKILHRPCIFNMPSVVAKLIFGQMANELLLNGQNIYPKKALDFGYKFKFDKIDEAIREAVL
jgi:uncharacterized protein (TIGR01777 family)